jgi:hypothetical protein
MILEYLKVFLSWPTVTLIIASTALLLFMNPLRALISRIRKGAAAGVSLEFSEQQPAVAIPATPAGAGPTYAELGGWFINEKRLNIIFGSQYNFVRALATRPEGLTDAEREVFFAEHKTRAPDSPWTLQDWLRWPIMEGLVQILGEDAGPNRTRLGPQGAAFINYLATYYGVALPARWG